MRGARESYKNSTPGFLLTTISPGQVTSKRSSSMYIAVYLCSTFLKVLKSLIRKKITDFIKMRSKISREVDIPFLIFYKNFVNINGICVKIASLFVSVQTPCSNWRKFLTALKLPPKKVRVHFFVPPSTWPKFPRGRRGGCNSKETTTTTPPWSSTTSATTASKFMVLVTDLGVQPNFVQFHEIFVVDRKKLKI